MRKLSQTIQINKQCHKHTLLSKRKNELIHKRGIGIRVLCVLSNIFASSAIKFSDKHNAKYGLPDLVTVLTEMSKSRKAAEGTARAIEFIKDGPTAKWFRNMINTLGPDEANALCTNLMVSTIQLAIKAGMYKDGLIIAIDKHLIPRYDRNIIKKIVHSQPKSGTSKFECYATIQAVSGHIKAMLDCIRLTKDDSNAYFIRKFMQTLNDYKICPKLLLMDREFFSVDVMSIFKRSKTKFLMPARKTPGIKKAIVEHAFGIRNAVSRCTITNKFGNTATFTLVIEPSDKIKDPKVDLFKRYVVYATNHSVKHALVNTSGLTDQYKKRWNIETAYRQIEEVRARTTSHNESYRTILFFTSLFMFNMWAIEKYQYMQAMEKYQDMQAMEKYQDMQAIKKRHQDMQACLQKSLQNNLEIATKKSGDKNMQTYTVTLNLVMCAISHVALLTYPTIELPPGSGDSGNM